MRKTAITEVKPGDRIARTLFYQYGGVMLRAGAVLTKNIIAKLKQLGYSYIYVYDKTLEDIIAYDYLDDDTKQKLTAKVRDAFNDIRAETASIISIRTPTENDTAATIQQKLKTDEIQRVVKAGRFRLDFINEINQMLENIVSEESLGLSVATIKNAANYIYDHSINVAILSVLLARRLGITKSELYTIAQGCLLHDIGYSVLPENIVYKTSSLTASEKELIKQHTTLGYLILKDHPDVSLLATHIAYQHHERQDGTGYPRGLCGTNKIASAREELYSSKKCIHRFANIVAVVDFYDLLITDLPNRKGIPNDAAIEKVKEVRGSYLNSEAVDAFLSIMPVYPVGTPVIVLDGKLKGYKGVVTETSCRALDKPKVRLLSKGEKQLTTPIEIDLRSENYTIRAIL